MYSLYSAYYRDHDRSGRSVFSGFSFVIFKRVQMSACCINDLSLNCIVLVCISESFLQFAKPFIICCRQMFIMQDDLFSSYVYWLFAFYCLHFYWNFSISKVLSMPLNRDSPRYAGVKRETLLNGVSFPLILFFTPPRVHVTVIISHCEFQP